MKTSACSLRSTQTRSLAEYLREQQCSLLLAAGRGGLAVLGADRDGLIWHQALLRGAEAVASQGDQVAAWGRRRLEMLFQGRPHVGIAGTPRRPHPVAAAVKAASVALATGLALAHSPATAGAATIVFTETASVSTGIDVGWNSTPTFVDIDGDGDLDAFVGEFYGTVKYFENTGSSKAPALVERTGTANPLNGVDVGLNIFNSTPTFADIDGDGDMDAFIGEYYGTVLYFRNTGSALAPVLVEQTGPANPLNGVDVGYYSAPTFVDIDGDGDLDAFIGEYYGISYYENTGSKTAPTLVERSGTANPLGSIDVAGGNSTPTFADIDGDGDLDAFIGEYGIWDNTITKYVASVLYFKNTGSRTAPVLVGQTGTANPLNSVRVVGTYGGYSAPTFADIDGDGDLDAFIGEYYGTVKYFRNDTRKFPWAMFLPAITAHSGTPAVPASYWSALSYLYCPTSATTFSLTSGGVTKKSVMPPGGSSGGSGTFEGWVTTTPGTKAFSWQLTSATCGSWTGNFSHTLQDMKNYSFSMDINGAGQPAVFVTTGNGKPATAASNATGYAAVYTTDWSSVAFKGGLQLTDKVAPLIQPEIFKSSRN